MTNNKNDIDIILFPTQTGILVDGILGTLRALDLPIPWNYYLSG